MEILSTTGKTYMYILTSFFMKKFSLLFIGLFFFISLFGQSDKKNLIGTHIASGIGNITSFRITGIPEGVTGVGWYKIDVKYYGGIGVDYSRVLTKHWDIRSGFEYTYDRIICYGSAGPDFGLKSSFSSFAIPIELKYRFKKYFYISGGIFLNVLGGQRHYGYENHDNVDFESLYFPHKSMSFGYGLGIGFEHTLNSGIVLYLSPNVRWNGTRKITYDDNETVPMSLSYALFLGGMNLGIGYKF